MKFYTVQELCESPGGRPGLPVSNSPCGPKATLSLNSLKRSGIACKSRWSFLAPRP